MLTGLVANYDLALARNGFLFHFEGRSVIPRCHPPKFVFVLVNPDIARSLCDSGHQIEPA